MSKYGLKEVVLWIATERSQTAASGALGVIDVNSEFWRGMLHQLELMLMNIGGNVSFEEMQALIPEGVCKHLYFNNCPAGCHEDGGQ
jgi:hypothetical protein